jgi:hypothetical protein
MTTRRQLAILPAAAGLNAACSPTERATREHEELAGETWRIAASPPTEGAATLRELVRLGTLAANGHNTQPWRFRLDGGGIAVLPDLSRRTPVVDPDDHHLFASLGCAAENIVQAAPAFGLRATPRFDAETGAVRIAIARGPLAPSPLYPAIPERQSTRSRYDGSALTVAEIAALNATVDGDEVALVVVTERPRIEQILDFVVTGNTAQMTDPAFMRELKHWVRFNARHAAETRDGLYAGSSGNPTLPRWIARPAFDLAVTAPRENARYAEHIRSSAAVAVFAPRLDAPGGWVEAGRACQRFGLQATALGLRYAFINQPTEVQALRPQFAALLGLRGRRPSLVVRVGRAPPMPRALRRPAADVMA